MLFFIVCGHYLTRVLHKISKLSCKTVTRNLSPVLNYEEYNKPYMILRVIIMDVKLISHKIYCEALEQVAKENI